MNYQVRATQRFSADIEFYTKKRHYSHIDDDIQPIINELEKGNLIGDPITDVVKEDSHRAYKARALNTNTNFGKSNGYRLIYYAISEDGVIYLLTIYMKKDTNRIPTNSEIADIIETYCP